MSQPLYRPLAEVFKSIPDPRHAQGKRYPLVPILILTCAAMLCGATSASAILQWGRDHTTPEDPATDVPRRCGFATSRLPCLATLLTVFQRLDSTIFEQVLAAWASEVLQRAAPAAGWHALAVDGKILRTASKQAPPGIHLVSVFSHLLGLTCGQQALADASHKRHELATVLALLEGRPLQGCVFTGDALLTSTVLTTWLRTHEGHYLFVVKQNTPELYAEIHRLFTDTPDLWQPCTTAVTTTAGHGRVETRRLWASAALVHSLPWAGVQQVLYQERTVRLKRSGMTRHDRAYAITSLPPHHADARQLLQLWRGHWSIENRSHWIRDMDFQEDRSTIRTGHAPQVMAALRNVVIGLLHLHEVPNIAATLRRNAAQYLEAFAFLDGIRSEN